MHVVTIAVVDATRARLFTFEGEASAQGIPEAFVERIDLVNLHEDHGDVRTDRFDAEFERDVIAEVERVAAETHSPRVILCASPNILGELRKSFGDLHDRVTIATLPRDLARLGTAELRARLAEYGLLPPTPR